MINVEDFPELFKILGNITPVKLSDEYFQRIADYWKVLDQCHQTHPSECRCPCFCSVHTLIC